MDGVHLISTLVNKSLYYYYSVCSFYFNGCLLRMLVYFLLQLLMMCPCVPLTWTYPLKEQMKYSIILLAFT